MATYLIRKTKFSAIEWNGSNLTAIQSFVANLPSLDNFYSQYTGVSVTQSSGVLTISTNEGGNVGFGTGELVIEGCAATTGNLVANLPGSPFYFRVDV